MGKATTTNSVRVPPSSFYGWVIVFISALGLFFSGPGQTYSVSIFINSYIQEFGWSRSFVSSFYSAGTLAAGLVFFKIGHMIDKKGHRFMLPVVSILFGLACIWMSRVSNPAMLFIGFFCIRLLGQGSMTLLSVTLVPQWFISKRGRALSLMSIGGVLGSALLPPWNTWMITTWGWRVGWRFWALLLIVCMAPLARVLVRNRPEDIGLRPDNNREDTDDDAKRGDTTLTEHSWTLVEAKRTKTFWLLIFSMFVPSMVNTGLVFHMVSILGEQGISPEVAALVLSLMAIVALPVTFIAGYLLDRVKQPNYIMALSFFGQVILMILLIYARSTPLALLFGVLRGIVAGFEGITFNAIWPAYFGRLYLGSIRGFSMTVMVIASAFGPLPFGVAFDLFGGYQQIIWIMTVFPLLGIITGFAAVKPQRSKRAKIDAPE